MKKLILKINFLLISFAIANSSPQLDWSTIIGGNDSSSANKLSLSNYPNPFNESTTIEWYLPEEGAADISIYNLSGDKLVNIASDYFEEGLYSKEFNNRSLISGAYNLVLRFGNQIVCKPLIIEK